MRSGADRTDKQKIRIIKENDEHSMGHQPDDIFTVDSTRYGGVNVTSVSGIPLFLDRDEYEALKDEGQPPHPIDVYSCGVGVMDCLCEVVSGGPKRFVMSHLCDTRAERGSYLGQVQRFYTKCGIRYYPEGQALITGLFPERTNKDKFNYLFLRTEDALEQHMALKERQRCLIRDNGYTAQVRHEPAVEFGLLLSYLEDGIARLIQKTTGKQQTKNYNGVLSESESTQP